MLSWKFCIYVANLFLWIPVASHAHIYLRDSIEIEKKEHVPTEKFHKQGGILGEMHCSRFEIIVTSTHSCRLSETRQVPQCHSSNSLPRLSHWRHVFSSHCSSHSECLKSLPQALKQKMEMRPMENNFTWGKNQLGAYEIHKERKVIHTFHMQAKDNFWHFEVISSQFNK